MPHSLVRPSLSRRAGGRGGVVMRRAVAPRTAVQGPILTRLTVLWVQTNGVPFSTAGFFAQLVRNGAVVATASFDRYGVVRFSSVGTLTNRSFTLRLFNPSGVLFRTRTIPAGVEAFAVIG